MKLKLNNTTIIFLISVMAFISCKNEKSSSNYDTETEAVNPIKNYVKVVTTGMDFDLIDKTSSGWTTFEYINNSDETHFLVLEKMPDTLGLYTYRKELFPPFIAAFEHFEKGEMQEGMKEFEKIPEWFYKVEYAGGVGLTSQKTTSKSTIYLEPGKYVMECYVRMPNGMPHTFFGMVKELEVTEELNNIEAPKSDYNITLSSEEGISFVDSLKVGKYTLAVNFKDQKQYEHLMGHDVNLVKIQNDTLIDSLNNWINAGNFESFRTPAPEGLKFLGGVEDLPSGKTGYFEVSLEKGNYVLISEIPNAVERKMIKTFSVID